jgi:hypothetical protein
MVATVCGVIRSSELISNSTLADTSIKGVLKGALKPYLRVKVQSPRESDALENGFRERAELDGAEFV